MPALALYVVLAVVPASALVVGVRALDRWCRSWRTRSLRPAGPAIERLVTRLRRLEDDYRRTSGSDLPGRVARLRSIALAYDDVLAACCRAVGLPEPAVPLSGVSRLETEAALAQHGVTW